MVFWISKERNQILLVIPHIFIFYFFLSIFCELNMLEIWLHLIKKKHHVISIENFEWIHSQKLLQDVNVNEQEHNRASFEHQRIPLWGIKLTFGQTYTRCFLASIHCLPSTNVLINIKNIVVSARGIATCCGLFSTLKWVWIEMFFQYL